MKLLAENMLRFGVKNLNESDVNNILRIISEENEDLPDWSKGGTRTWEKANIKDLVAFVKAVDVKSGASYVNSETYKAMMDWFSANDSAESRASLKAWVFDNIVYGSNQQPKIKKRDLKNDPTLGQDLGTVSQALTSLSTWGDAKYYQNPKNGEALKSYITKLQQEITAYNKKGISFANTKAVRTFILEIRTIIKDLTLLYKTAQAQKKKLDQITDSDIENASTKSYDSVQAVIERFSDLIKDGGFGYEFDINTDDGDVKVDMTKTGANLTAIKLKVLQNLRQSVIDAEGEEAAKNFAKALKSAKKIYITNQMSEIKSGWTEYTNITKQTGTSDIITPAFCFPPNNVSGEERSVQGASMFTDDGTTLTDVGIQGIEASVNQAAEFIRTYAQKVEEIKSQVEDPDNANLEIVSFTYAAYSSTSWVRTRYKGKNKDGEVIKGKFNDKNNEPLARDRYTAMIDELKRALEENEVVIEGENTYLSDYEAEPAAGPAEVYIKPNQGPKWREMGGTIPQTGQQVTIQDYGPLYQQAYARNNELTPQQFYAARNRDAAINATKYVGSGLTISPEQLNQEYESVYGPYRQTTCAFNIVLRMPTLIAKEETIQDFVVGGTAEMLISVDFPVGVDWTGIKRNIKKKFRKFKGKLTGGGGRPGAAPMPVFKGRSTACPSWG